MISAMHSKVVGYITQCLTRSTEDVGRGQPQIFMLLRHLKGAGLFVLICGPVGLSCEVSGISKCLV